MSETSQNKATPDDKKRHRRSRKDGHERTYVCSQCQKSYLSNAALYTHTKTKHQNPSQKSIRKEGEGNPQEKKDNEQQSGQSQEQKQNQNSEQNQSALQDLRSYMKKYFPERNKGSSVRLISQGLTPNIQQYIAPILIAWEQRSKPDQDRNQLKIDQVFGLFLHQMNSRVSSTCMNFLVRVFYYMREGLKIEHRRNLYCQNESAALLPNDFNNLILNHRIPPESVDEDELMNNYTIVCKVLEYFGNWLYDEKFTDYKIVGKFPTS